MPPKCSGQKYFLTAICNLYHVIRPGSSLSVWLYLIMENSKEERTVLLFPSALITKNVWLKREKQGTQDYNAVQPRSHWLQNSSSVYDIPLSFGRWLFHAPIYTAEKQWIRRELAFRLVTSSNFQAERISEEPTAPNTIGNSINVRSLIQPAHNTNN